MIVETPWETRNLGLPAFTVSESFFESPDFPELAARLQSIGAAFVSARVPASRVELLEPLGRFGFYVVEQTIELSARARKDPLLEAFADDTHAFVPPRVSRDDLTIAAGESALKYWEDVTRLASGAFGLDRFHRDYRCPDRIAEQRTKYWLAQIARDPEVDVVVMLYREEPSAFIIRRGPRILLGASSHSFHMNGISLFGILTTRLRARLSGFETITSVVPPSVDSLNSHIRAGFRVRKQSYTLHRWWTEQPYGQ